MSPGDDARPPGPSASASHVKPDADRVSSQVATELESLRKSWEQQAPGIDVSPMAVLTRLAMVKAYRGRAYDRLLAPFGLASIESHTLMMLLVLGPGASACPSDLVRLPIDSRTGMTRALDRLETRGLVERSIDREDRRRIRVSLTHEGRELAIRYREVDLEFMHRVLDGIPDDERVVFCRVLDRLMDNFAAVSGVPEHAS